MVTSTATEFIMAKDQFACVNSKPIIAIGAPVTIEAAAKDGDKSLPPAFIAEFYTGGALEIDGWDLPVVVDLAGLEESKVLVANLDHDSTKRVGNFAVANDGKSLVAKGTASARTPARDEVVGSAEDGYQWQASLEVRPREVEAIKKGQSVEVNGQSFNGPLYITRKGVLKGFAFVSHGADDNTSATIAASAASSKEQNMKAEVKAWVESLGLKAEDLTDEQVANFTADYEGREGKRTPKVIEGSSPAEKRKIEAKRRIDINELADQWMAKREGDLQWIEAVEEMRDHAIEAKQSLQEFRSDLLEASLPLAHTVNTRRTDRSLSNRVLMAAICQAGALSTVEKDFTDQELQLAHDRFPHGISLGQLFILAAEANGYRGTTGGQVTTEIQRAAFGQSGPMIRASGFSTIDIANVVAATANKFLHEGWMHVDQTPLRIARIKPVRNFHQHTTVSLTGALQFEKLGSAGEIKHGTLDDLTYTNQADTYGAMLAITRKDIINDDLGALTAVPRRLGRGGALKLNDIFWARFLALVSESFFASGKSNINTGVADMTLGGLEATETIFMNQTDPDGKPVGFMPRILLVPTALKAKAAALMADQPGVFITGKDAVLPAANVYAGRFRVESSPYISNSSYTGNTAVGWWMLADPNDEAVIEIAALNGRVEPVVDTADADFNTLGVQMRGYCDIGVKEQEYRAGVYADGGAS
jgi:hypothetical protein